MEFGSDLSFLHFSQSLLLSFLTLQMDTDKECDSLVSIITAVLAIFHYEDVHLFERWFLTKSRQDI